MKVLIKHLVFALIALVLGGGITFAQQSDYDISVAFKDRLETLNERAAQTKSVKDTDAVNTMLTTFELDFMKHKDIIDVAVYPSSFESIISALKSDLARAEHKWLIIENQNDRLNELTYELNTFKNELSILTKKNEHLRKAIAASEKNEERLSSLIAQYKDNLQERDAFILDMIDSVFIVYQRVSETDKENNAVTPILNGDENIIAIVDQIIDDNLEYLNDTYALGSEDYLRMYSVQKKFAHMWSDAGSDLIGIYGGKFGEVKKADIDSKLLKWEDAITTRTWSSVTGYLEGLGFEIPPFHDKDSFFTSLDEYITAQTVISSEDGVSASSYPLFKDFKAFWSSTFKDQWAAYVQDSDLLTLSQISYLDEKVTTWEGEAIPTSYNMYLVTGFLTLLILTLSYVIIRQRKLMAY